MTTVTVMETREFQVDVEDTVTDRDLATRWGEISSQATLVSTTVTRRDDLPDVLSIGEAATMAGVRVETMRRWLDSGTLPSFRTPGGHRRVRTADVAAVLTGTASPLVPA
jgi:excisionase family DNA binding protein